MQWKGWKYYVVKKATDELQTFHQDRRSQSCKMFDGVPWDSQMCMQQILVRLNSGLPESMLTVGNLGTQSLQVHAIVRNLTIGRPDILRRRWQRSKKIVKPSHVHMSRLIRE